MRHILVYNIIQYTLYSPAHASPLDQTHPYTPSHPHTPFPLSHVSDPYKTHPYTHIDRGVALYGGGRGDIRRIVRACCRTLGDRIRVYKIYVD